MECRDFFLAKGVDIAFTFRSLHYGMLFLILICLNIYLLRLEENLVGGHYCFPSGCLYFE